MFYSLTKRQILLVLGDAIIIAVCLYMSLLLRFEFKITEPHIARYKDYVFLVVAVYIIIFYCFGLYRSIWRFASVHELLNVVFAVTLGNIVTVEIGRASCRERV